jgi:large subunit ribosomal protein L9
MQIILLEKIANVGNLGDVVKVKAGFARNFLIPKGMAKRATPENLKLLESKRAELEKAAGEKLAAAQALGEKLEGAAVKILQKAGVDGRLFGSVGNVDVVEALAAQGITIEKAQVRMPSGPLKTVGDHPVTIALHTDVVAHITVTVQADTVVVQV